MPAVLEDLDFIRIFHEGGAKKVVEASGVTERQAYQRRVSLEKKYGIQIKGPGFRPQSTTRHAEDHAAVVERKVRDGVVLVGSDAHIWPHQRERVRLRAVRAGRRLPAVRLDPPPIVAWDGAWPMVSADGVAVFVSGALPEETAMTFTVLVCDAEGRLAVTHDVAPQARESVHDAPARILKDARAVGCSLCVVMGPRGVLAHYGAGGRK
jgi:hypothetical protein